jgi:hypothetical protein
MGKFKKLAHLLLAGTLLISSCAKEDDDSTGDARDKFVGSWTCKETHVPNAHDTSTVNNPFPISITKASGTAITISNFNHLSTGNTNVEVEALVSGSILNIPSQTRDGFKISGTGSYSNDRIEMSYKVDDDSYTAICTKN